MSDLYFGDDGVIHSRSAEGSGGAVPARTTNNSPARVAHAENNVARSAQEGRYSNGRYVTSNYVSETRIRIFWIFTILAGILVGLCLYKLTCAPMVSMCNPEEMEEAAQNRFWTWMPWVFVMAGCIGSCSYGYTFADLRHYDLWAFVLSALSAVAGIIIGAVAIGILCILLKIVLYIVAFILVIAILVSIFSCFS